MNLIKFDPFTPASPVNRLFDSFFNMNVGDLTGSDFAVNIPSVNVKESDESFILEVAAPGIRKEDFKISLEKDHIKISSEVESKDEENVEGRYTRREFNYSAFSRSFFLPKSIDKDAITANYENGVLTVVLPKKAEVVREEKGRNIEIL